MKKIKKVEAGQFYVFQSTASANSVYFESEELIKTFFKYFNYFLKDYLSIYEYALNKDGWVVVIKVKSQKTVKKYYLKNLKNKNKSTEFEVWRVISERIRIFLSTYVRVSNKVLGREGTLVRKSFERFILESKEEAKRFIAEIRKNKVNRAQKKKKYQGNLNHFRIANNRLNTNILFTSKKLYEGDTLLGRVRKIFGGNLPIIRCDPDLVEQLFIKPINKQFTYYHESYKIKKR